MSTTSADALTAFHWTPQPKAEALVKELLAEFLGHNSFAAGLAKRMQEETGTRFIDWIDHILCASTGYACQRLDEAGFVSQGSIYVHEGGMFPKIVLRDQARTHIAIKVQSIEDFLAALNVTPLQPVDAPPLAPLRRARINAEKGSGLWIIERHGFDGFMDPAWSEEKAAAVARHDLAFHLRQRNFPDERQGIAALASLMDAAIAALGAGYATDRFFAAEREYWQTRNRAARVQKSRQDRLGLGWANHDHHTYRSSREHFAPMIALFEKLGLVCRERFYAGADSGWGAQILEHPHAGIIVFADVDLSPDELRGDFAHDGLAPRQELGTVGLWCALHGEAILQAGMHHLECQFDFDALRRQLEQEEQVKVMKPFTDFPYLRQAFTEGEVWPVAEDRIGRLLANSQITAEQAEQFRTRGALGSHMENLERNEGFKGFNQKGVSDIIARTDPRAAKQL